LLEEKKNLEDEYKKISSQEAPIVDELNQKIEDLKKEREQLVLGREMVENLKKRNLELENRESENVSKIETLKEELTGIKEDSQSNTNKLNEDITRLQNENTELLLLSKKNKEDALKFKRDLELREKVNNQRLNESNKMVDLLTVAKQESDKAQEELINKQLVETVRDVDELKKERDVLFQGEITNSPTSVLTCNDNEVIAVTAIIIANTSVSTKWFSMWHDPNGTTYDDTTKLFDEIDITKNDSAQTERDETFYLVGGGNIAFEASQNNSITVTIYGNRRQLE